MSDCRFKQISAPDLGVAVFQPCLLVFCFFFSTLLLLPACHYVNRWIADSFSCTVLILPSSYRILYCADSVEIKDTTVRQYNNTATIPNFTSLLLSFLHHKSTLFLYFIVISIEYFIQNGTRYGYIKSYFYSNNKYNNRNNKKLLELPQAQNIIVFVPCKISMSLVAG